MSLEDDINRAAKRQQELYRRAGKSPLSEEELEELQKIRKRLALLYDTKRRGGDGSIPNWLVRTLGKGD